MIDRQFASDPANGALGKSRWCCIECGRVEPGGVIRKARGVFTFPKLWAHGWAKVSPSPISTPSESIRARQTPSQFFTNPVGSDTHVYSSITASFWNLTSMNVTGYYYITYYSHFVVHQCYHPKKGLSSLRFCPPLWTTRMNSHQASATLDAIEAME